MMRLSEPVPVINAALLQSSGKRHIANTNTSVSGDMMWTSAADSAV